MKLTFSVLSHISQTVLNRAPAVWSFLSPPELSGFFIMSQYAHTFLDLCRTVKTVKVVFYKALNADAQACLAQQSAPWPSDCILVRPCQASRPLGGRLGSVSPQIAVTDTSSWPNDTILPLGPYPVTQQQWKVRHCVLVLSGTFQTHRTPAWTLQARLFLSLTLSSTNTHSYTPGSCFINPKIVFLLILHVSLTCITNTDSTVRGTRPLQR